MKRPRFKLDGRYGRIRSTQPDGRVWWRNDRVCRCWDAWLQAVLAGTAHGTGQMQLIGGKGAWHDVAATPAEAKAALLGRKLGGTGTVVRCERIRASRAERGLPVAGSLEPEQENR